MACIFGSPLTEDDQTVKTSNGEMVDGEMVLWRRGSSQGNKKYRESRKYGSSAFRRNSSVSRFCPFASAQLGSARLVKPDPPSHQPRGPRGRRPPPQLLLSPATTIVAVCLHCCRRRLAATAATYVHCRRRSLRVTSAASLC